MPSWVQDVGQITVAQNANANCFAGSGSILGIFVSSASATPLLTVKDEAVSASGSPSAGNTNAVAQTFVPVVGFTPIKAQVRNGLYVAMTGNVAYTVIWNR